MRAILCSKAAVEAWAGAVQDEARREADLLNLLEYYNKDDELASKLAAKAVRQWGVAARDEAAELGGAARQHRCVATWRLVVRHWRATADAAGQARRRRQAFASACASTLSCAHARWIEAAVFDAWLRRWSLEADVAAQIECAHAPLVSSLQVRRQLLTKQQLLHAWRHALALRVANELALVRAKTRLCVAWGEWRRQLLDAAAVHPAEWQEAVARDRVQLLRGGMLGLGLHVYTQAQREAWFLARWSGRWISRCWRRWRHVQAAIAELRGQQRRRQAVGAAFCQRLRAAAGRAIIGRWKEAARMGSMRLAAAEMLSRRDTRVVQEGFEGWRQRAAWWSDSWCLSSYRAPRMLAAWTAMRAAAAAASTAAAWLALRRYIFRVWDSRRRAEEMAQRQGAATEVAVRAWAGWRRCVLLRSLARDSGVAAWLDPRVDEQCGREGDDPLRSSVQAGRQHEQSAAAATNGRRPQALRGRGQLPDSGAEKLASDTKRLGSRQRSRRAVASGGLVAGPSGGESGGAGAERLAAVWDNGQCSRHLLLGSEAKNEVLKSARGNLRGVCVVCVVWCVCVCVCVCGVYVYVYVHVTHALTRRRR